MRLVLNWNFVITLSHATFVSMSKFNDFVVDHRQQLKGLLPFTDVCVDSVEQVVVTLSDNFKVAHAVGTGCNVTDAAFPAGLRRPWTESGVVN